MTKNEILNIEWHTCRLIVKALNMSKDKNEAYHRLGVSERTLYRLINTYSIYYKKAERLYIAGNMPKYEIVEPHE